MGQPEFTAALNKEMNRAGENQSSLGRKAGVAPAMLSAWVNGHVQRPDPEKVFDVERALDVAPGYLSQHLGFVPASGVDRPIDVKSAIDADPLLQDLDKEALRLLYNVFRRRSAPSETVSDAPASTVKKPRTASST